MQQSFCGAWILYFRSLCLIVQPKKKNEPCRYDWHQTLNSVVISIYAKACVPELCSFEANATNVSGNDLTTSIIINNIMVIVILILNS